MSHTNRDVRDREAEAKLAQKRVQNVEKHFGLICATVGSITRKNARLRDKGDLLAQHLMAFAENEKLNPSTRMGVLQFAENYAVVQDYCHAKVQRMENKVLKPLTRYGELCRYVKRNIKSEISACGKEKKVVQKLEKLQSKSDNQSQIVELELEKVQGEEQVVGEAMEVEVDKFEKDKILDVKNVLTELVRIEMLYHAKALEYLSKCFESMEQVNVEEDLQEFRSSMTRLGNSGGRNRGDVSARSQRSAQKVRVDASTLTSTGSTRRSQDTRASSTFSTSSLSSATRSTRQGSIAHPSSHGRQVVQPSPRERPSPRVRISSSRMYQDDDDDDESDDDDDDY